MLKFIWSFKIIYIYNDGIMFYKNLCDLNKKKYSIYPNLYSMWMFWLFIIFFNLVYKTYYTLIIFHHLLLHFVCVKRQLRHLKWKRVTYMIHLGVCTLTYQVYIFSNVYFSYRQILICGTNLWEYMLLRVKNMI